MTGYGDVAGFVLVGGRSSRMGTDKALMKYHGLPLAGYIANELSRVAESVSLVGDRARYSGIGYPVLGGDYPGGGPVGGIVTALRASGSIWNIVTACDLPGVSAEFFGRLLDRTRRLDVQCVIPVTPDGRAQVLCAVRTDYWPLEAGEWSVNLNTPEDGIVHIRQEA